MSTRRKRRRMIPRGYIYIAAAVLAIIILAVGIVFIRKYTPTREHMELSDYFETSYVNEAAVVLNNEYEPATSETGHAYAIVDGDQVYLELNYLKDNLDDGYVYDSSEITLRYTTDSDIYTALLGASDYTINKSNESFGSTIILAQDDTVYINAEYIKLLTNFEYSYYGNPNRVFIETVGYEKQVTTARGKSQIRKLNGPKSPILEDVTKGETIYVIRDTGKWSFVVSENGVMGYMKNNKISKQVETATVEATLPERQYHHISVGSDISLLWHQVTSQDANNDIANVLADVGNIDVISPTWFYLNSNSGSIASLGSTSYVNYCHSNNVQVWGLVSNLEDDTVDTATVLNTTSARDKLINNIIAQAITYGLDGVNVDFEELPGAAADGYIEFIRELSIKCENNDIVLSIDNYVPTASSECYNRAEQAKYADYIIMMGYDEHHGSSEEAGSVASLDWVETGVQDTLDEVPAEQLILGMPFYCRAWELDSEGTVLSSKAYGLSGIQTFLNTNSATVTWDETEGQNYAEFIKGDSTYKIWVEDEESLEAKLKLIDSYGLAGGAFWKYGFDNDSVWNLIAKYL